VAKAIHSAADAVHHLSPRNRAAALAVAEAATHALDRAALAVDAGDAGALREASDTVGALAKDLRELRTTDRGTLPAHRPGCESGDPGVLAVLDEVRRLLDVMGAMSTRRSRRPFDRVRRLARPGNSSARRHP
jgi:hypothetical protein